jgi:hypothetical protein
MSGAATPQSRNRQDGTLTLLRVGFWVFLVGAVCLLLTLTVFGGVARHGPHTDPGWLTFTFGLLFLPLGLMLLGLGGAKWLRNR